jgi:transcriptional regulator with XRE-family HTH domain
MYYMHMNAKGNSDSLGLIEKLNAEMDSRGFGQQDLARLLGISQGHLSKILTGRVAPGRRTVSKMRALISSSAQCSGGTGGWLSAVDAAARRSRPFRSLVNAALEMVSPPSRRGRSVRRR